MKKLMLLLVLLLPLLLSGCSDDDAAATYSVTYDANGADAGAVPVDPAAYSAGSDVTVLDNTNGLANTGYSFAGWNSAADGSGTVLAAGDTFEMPASNVTLYAQWLSPAETLSNREMVSVPGGTYTQEDDTGDSFEHTVSSFQIGKYEVTYELWHTVYSWATNNGYTFANAGKEGDDGTAGADPTTAKHEPVTHVNWRDVIIWCNAYSQMVGYTPVYYSDSGYNTPIKTSSDSSTFNTNAGSYDNPYVNWNADGYRLPTEGEWQYAASYRDGSSWTPCDYASGATADYTDATATGAVAWYEDNSGSTTHDVGTKTANQLGIHDMSGNALEWCWDRYEAWPTASQSDYRGGDSSSVRVIRGGYYSTPKYSVQVGHRNNHPPYFEYIDIFGFRAARTP